MERRVLKVSRWLSVMAVAVMFFCGVSSANATSINFGATAEKTKIGDAVWSNYGGGYHDIVVDGSDVYVPYLDNVGPSEYLLRLGTSHDDGVTWGKSTVIARLSAYSDTYLISVGTYQSNKVIHMAWDAWDPTLGKQVFYYANSLNGWTPVTADGGFPVIGYAKSMAVDSSGIVHLAFAGGNGFLYYTKSSDNGLTFDYPTTITNVNGGEPSIGVDSQGNVYAAWINGCTGGIYFSKLAGTQWSQPLQVTSKAACNGVSLVVKDSNNIYIGWAYQEGVYVIGTSDGGTTWPSLPHTVTTPGGGDAASLVLASNGALNIAWGTPTGVYFSRSTNNGSTWTNPIYVMKTEGFPNMAVDAAGKVNIVDSNSTLGAFYFTKEK